MSGKDRERLGALVRRLREEAGLSVYAMAQAVDMNRTTLHRIEEGTYLSPKLETLNRFARVFGIDVEVLYDALWAERTDPLPSAPVYFRSKYHLDDTAVAELDAAVQEYLAKRRRPPTNENKHERRSP